MSRIIAKLLIGLLIALSIAVIPGNASTTQAQAQSLIPLHRRSPAAPAVAGFNSTLYLIYSDLAHRLQVVTSKDGTHWTNPASVGQMSAPVEPAMAVLGNHLYLAYIANDSTFDLEVVSTTDGQTWSPPNPSVAQQQSHDAPRLAVLNNTLYLVYRTNNGTNDLLLTSSTDGVTWAHSMPIGQKSPVAPALTMFNNALYLAYVGLSDDIHVVTSTDGTNWKAVPDPSQVQLTAAPPTLAVINNALDLTFVTNDGSNALLSIQSADGTTWAADTPLQLTSPFAPAVVAFTSTTDKKPAAYAVFTANDNSGDLYSAILGSANLSAPNGATAVHYGVTVTPSITPIPTRAPATLVPTVTPTSTTATTVSAVDASNNGLQPIGYEAAVHGEFTSSTVLPLSYVLTGSKGDVVRVLFTSVVPVVPNGVTYGLVPRFVVKDASGASLVDTMQQATFNGPDQSSNDATNLTTYKTFYFVLAQDGPATITLTTGQAKVNGTFDMVFHRVSLLTDGTPAAGQIDYKMLTTFNQAIVYAFKSSGPFRLDYSNSGPLNITLQVGRIQANGQILPVGLLGGGTSDAFSPKANGKFSGGSLLENDPGSVFIVSLGNDVFAYDDPDTVFVKNKDTDSAQYNFTLHNGSGSTSNATSSAPSPTMVPTRSNTATPLAAAASTTPSSGQPSPIAYDTPVQGDMAAAVPQVDYVLTGAPGDVVEAFVTLATAKGAKPAQQTELRVLAAGKTLVDSSNPGDGSNSASGGSSLYSNGFTGQGDASGGMTYTNSDFFSLSAGGSATIVLLNRSAVDGTFTIVLHRVPLLAPGTPLSGQIDSKTLAASHGPAILYALRATGSFSLDYRLSGALNLTLQVAELQTNGALRTVGFVGGQSSDPFAPKTNGSFSGGSLLMNPGPLYIVSLGNNINKFDFPGFGNDAAADSARYRVIMAPVADTASAATTAS